MGVDNIVFGVSAICIILTGVGVVFIQESYADLTVEQVEILLDEQKQLEEDLIQIKKDLVENQRNIISVEREISSLKSELRLLDNAEADDTQVQARENVLLAKINELKKLKFDRIDMLAKSSETEQRINTINSEVQFNVKGLDTEEVKIVSPDKINLQINIKEIKKQITILDQIDKVIDSQIQQNIDQINDFKRILQTYQNEYDSLSSEVRTTWEALGKRNNTKTLIDSMNTVISGHENNVADLRKDKTEIANQKRTLIHVLETAQADLAELNFDETNQRKLVGVMLSKSCVVMLKNNFTTNCPTYEDLAVLDSSNTYVSGNFVYDDNGFYHRENPKYNNSWNWYKHDEQIRLIIDPSGGFADRIPLIIITNNLDAYTTPEDRKIGNDNIRQYREGRYIDRCWTALVSDQIWGSILTDTISMLRNNCTESIYNEIKKEVLEPTEIDVTTSSHWQYSQWLNETKNNCKTICKQY